MNRLTQYIKLILTSLLYAFMISGLFKMIYPNLWLESAAISFIIWFVMELRFIMLLNNLVYSGDR